MREPIESYNAHGCKIEIFYDLEPLSPAELDDDPGYSLVHWHRRYSIFGCKERADTRDKPSDAVVIYPLYMLDHSGVRFSVGPFGDPWDSGQVGWIYFTRDQLLAFYGVKRVTRRIRECAAQALRAIVQEWDDYCSGDVYGFEVTANAGGFESCWGFIGDVDRCKDEAEAIARRMTVQLELLGGEP